MEVILSHLGLKSNIQFWYWNRTEFKARGKLCLYRLCGEMRRRLAVDIGLIAREVKAPISILAGPQSPSVSELQDLGVARVSYGSGFMKAAITGAKKLAQEILEKGTCSLLKDGVQTLEINALVARKK